MNDIIKPILFVLFLIILSTLCFIQGFLVGKSHKIEPVDRLTFFCSQMAKNHTEADKDVLEACFTFLKLNK